MQDPQRMEHCSEAHRLIADARTSQLADADGALLETITSISINWAEWAEAHGAHLDAAGSLALAARSALAHLEAEHQLDPSQLASPECLAVLERLANAVAQHRTAAEARARGRTPAAPSWRRDREGSSFLDPWVGRSAAPL